MINVLITGVNSYVGNSFEQYVLGDENYNVDKISVRGNDWESADFSKYDVVLHVAGIAHSDSGKISPERAKLYYEVNADLTEKLAIKCKNEDVKQFIYMSSMIIFGSSSKIGKIKIITKDTDPKPENAYGDSKLQAELKLSPLNDDKFAVCIIRPPMIYGKGSKGNYPTLSKYAKKLPVFPNVVNQRSMLYVENLCEFIKLMMQNNEQGVFMPQNEVYTNTSNMVKLIAETSGNKLVLTKMFNWGLYAVSGIAGVVNKVFGSLVYDMELSEYKEDYRVVKFEESIRRTEV